MQVTEKLSDGLKRELEIIVTAKDLEAKLKDQLAEMKDRVQLKGFRPGKVPLDYLRRLYGKSVMGEIIQKEVTKSSDTALKDRKERPAFQPQIKMTEDEKEVDQILDGKMDLSYVMAYEILPDFEMVDFSKMKIEKLVAEVDDKEIDAGVDNIVQNSISYKAVKRGAKDKDRLTLDFVGKLDGETFEGGTAEDAFLVLGSNSFIGGFEDGLIGAKAGDELTVEGNFPEDYNAEHLAGKTAQFDVTVKEVGKPTKPEINDEFAKTVGFETLEALREAVIGGIKQEQESYGRDKVKKNIMDALDDAHDFDLPPSLVDNEFDGIWEQITHKMGDDGKNFGEDGEESEEDARKKYQKIAERRVRLGLVLSQIAEKNTITINDQEVSTALGERIRQFPGQEQQVIEFYQNNPAAVAEIRAPLLEEKVVDYLLELMKVEEKTVSREELMAADEDDED
jgi:trigger factor